MDLSLIIPCYNEADSLPGLRQDLEPVLAELAAAYAVEVVFVDDGSRDGTWLALQDLFGADAKLPVEFRIARHDRNRGLGAALRTGFANATGDVLITTDSDGTYRHSEIPALLRCLVPGVHIVVASPYHPAGAVVGVPPGRLLLSRGSSLIYRLLVNRRIHTYTSLFRAYRRDVIEHVSFASDGFLAGTELLVNALLCGYQAAEYPTVLHVRAAGQSKAKLARTTLAHLRFQGQVLTRRLTLGQRPEPEATAGALR
jgi:dolichol-phosphate mannosyltransferase